MVIVFVCLLILLFYFIVLNKNKADQIHELSSDKYYLNNKIATLNERINKLTNESKNNQKEISKLEVENQELKEKNMSPAELKATRAKKRQQKSYELWEKDLEKNVKAGSKRFIWHCLEDGRVCDKCRKLEGHVFITRSIPKLKKFVKEHKGEDGCRCYLEFL